ncbi:PEP-CTERM sorting domain-containing protein [Rhodopirellula europaea]|uniref:PEP-CTERM sorting domain-containing protein n=1 Tax=Rhodopirellula europaea TaxID=1263866 RepID=UPI001181B6C5|nr:PEP-CTERM sorting domain-containing protein [Rhodopirellula europaea]
MDVYLEVDGDDLGSQIANWQSRVLASDISGSISEVTFGPAAEPVRFTDLFPGSLVEDSASNASESLGSSSFLDESNPALFDAAGLMSVSFSVPEGQAGDFDLVFASNVISDSNFTELNSDSIGSTITIQASAVPEPSSLIAIASVAALSGVMGRRLRRCKANGTLV